MSEDAKQVTCAGCDSTQRIDQVTIITHPDSWPALQQIEFVCDACWTFTANAIETWVREHPDQDRLHLHELQRRHDRRRS